MNEHCLRILDLIQDEKVDILELLKTVMLTSWPAKIDEFNELYGVLEFTTVKDVTAITAIMRGGFAARSKMPNWGPALIRARTRLEEMGLDPDRVLSGLFDHQGNPKI